MIRKCLFLTLLFCAGAPAKALQYTFGEDTYVQCIDGGYGYLLGDATLWVGTNHGLYGILASNFYFDSLNSPLPSNYITAVDLHYTDNNLWIGTNHGFCRRVPWPTNWTCFNAANNNLPSDSITCILDADHDSIWIGTRNGLVLYLQALDSFRLFTTSNSLLPSNHITCLEKFSFEPYFDYPYPIFVGTTSGIVKIEHNTWTEYDTSNSSLSGNFITAISADELYQSGNAWIATYGGGVSHLNNDTFTAYTTSNQKIKSDSLDFIEALAVNGAVFTGNHFDSLYKLNYSDEHFGTGWFAKPVVSASQNRGNGDWGWIGTDHEIYTFDFTEGISNVKHPVLWKATIYDEILYLFDLPHLYGKTVMKIIDLSGKTVVERTLMPGQIATQSVAIPLLAPGVYMVQLNNAALSESLSVYKLQ